MIFEQLGSHRCTSAEGISRGWDFCFGKLITVRNEGSPRSVHEFRGLNNWSSYARNRTSFKLELVR